MSFFSYLTLAANRGVLVPSQKELDAVFAAAGVSKPSDHLHGGYNLNGDITAIFDDELAKQENDRFFCPDAIYGHPSIGVGDFEDYYEGTGYSIVICGNGYLFPWSNADIRQRVLSHPKLQKLAKLVQETFGGHFERPNDDSEFWDQMIIDSPHGWAWLRHES